MPDGQEEKHCDWYKKYELMQEVHVVSEPKQVRQGEVQLLN